MLLVNTTITTIIIRTDKKINYRVILIKIMIIFKFHRIYKQTGTFNKIR